jgi:hypothetical protein
MGSRCHATLIAALLLFSNELMEVTGSRGVHAPYSPAAWAADQELRRLRAKLRRLEQELRDLGGAAEGERALLAG